MTDETTTEPEVLTSNIGYAAVPEGFVFVPLEEPGNTGVARKLLDAAENPEDVITRAGYGYVVPAALATKVGLDSEKPVTVIDGSTPDTVDAPTGSTAPTSDTGSSAADQPAADLGTDPTGATSADAGGADTTSTSTSKKSSAAAAAS